MDYFTSHACDSIAFSFLSMPFYVFYILTCPEQKHIMLLRCSLETDKHHFWRRLHSADTFFVLKSVMMPVKFSFCAGRLALDGEHRANRLICPGSAV